MQADILRKKFLDFFKSEKHKIVEPDSLVPKDDPTVLFTPAGMNQFKKEFMGYNSGFSRAATCQRCLRTDDLEKVGKTSGHHTFFEMLGNFSFGDYFKEEAISWAWEFLTQELKISSDKLWVSVYEDDDESNKIWKEKIKVGQDRVIKFGDKENFWPSEAKEKGPNGPCGPCSEIFFDLGKGTGCGKDDCNPSCNCGRFVEVWNLVFTQFNRKEGGILEPLPKKNIDTGMGLERLAAVIQGVKSNFETDLFQPIVKEIVSKCQSVIVSKDKELVYAVADHIRAIAFAILDGVLPSNDGRGYVVRKIIRKSILHLRQLGIRKPFLYKLVPVLSEAMKSYYPEMQTRKENIAEIILAEEKSFIEILDSINELTENEKKPILESAKRDKSTQPATTTGMVMASATTSNNIAISVVRLHDTHGLPPEETIPIFYKIIESEGVQRDDKTTKDDIEVERNKRKELSKSQSKMKGDVFSDKDMLYHVKATQFVGYKDYSGKANIIKIVKDNAEVKEVSQGDEALIILDKTPFYAEAGGQIGDTGELIKGKSIFEVLDTKKSGKVIIHIGKVKTGSFKKSDSVLAKLNLERRIAIARNHTATHLLQAALRRVLGVHVRQQGSLVAEDRLRFDFTHFKDIDRTQLDRIEELVNNYIVDNSSLCAKQMPLSEAKRKGALAFFAEKYETKVRVVSIGDFSQELCGGTHLDSTGQIGIFKIIHEGSVAQGIRRIEAVTGKQAYRIVKEEEGIIADVSSMLNVPQERIAEDLEKRLSRLKELERQLHSQRLDAVKTSLDAVIQNAQIINGIKIITHIMENVDMDLLRKSVDSVKSKTSNAVIALGSKSQERALLVVGVTSDLCEKGFDSSKLILNAAPIIGGSGAGRKDFAQAGGNKPENLEAAFQELKNIITNLK
jgi:alanyl-tRNA synthetase